MDNNKYINSRILFYLPEIIILCIYLIVYSLASAKEHNFLLGGLMFGGISLAFFIIEHRTDLLLDRINNIITIREKMLFINKYIIKKQDPLSDILEANVVNITHYDTKDKITTTTYKLRLDNKDGSIIYPFGNWSDSNQQKWQNMADKINKFKETQESTFMMLSRKPFFFRLCFGIPFGFLYFLVGLGIIFPKEMQPIIYNILSILFCINGYK